jgi:hypothetical protein
MNTQGDFDQLSIAGADFGQDNYASHEVDPVTLEGEYIQMGDYDADKKGEIQMGEYFSELGEIPEGMGCDYEQMGAAYQQMGACPSGQLGGKHQQLGGYYGHQLGSIHRQLGTHNYQLGGFMDTLSKPLFNVGAFTVTPLIAGIAAALGYFAYKKSYHKKLPFFK